METIMAICYDFDETLATSYMQEYSFIPKIKMTNDEFWEESQRIAEKNNIDLSLSYLLLMKQKCDENNIVMTRDFLNSMGKKIKLFKGVLTWFDRINQYAKENNIKLEHYLITSGNREIVEGCPIFNKFNEIFASEYLYDKNGVAFWPKRVINYTMKTQCLFRINKGVLNMFDESTVNQRVKNKHVEFSNMVYIGDGFSDIPSMTLVKEKGGIAISVYAPNKEEVSKQLLKDDRVNFVCKSDYSENSQVDKLIKTIIDGIAIKAKLQKISKK